MNKTIIYITITIFLIFIIFLHIVNNINIDKKEYKYSICFDDGCWDTNSYKIIKNNCIYFFDEVHKNKITTCKKYTIIE